jgi:hypothetical protein
MSRESGKERRWLRPLGLFGVVLALAVVRPLVLISIPFAAITLVERRSRVPALLFAVLLLALAFAGATEPGLWYFERGWGILLAGCFAAATLAWPGSGFVTRGLSALAGSVVATGVAVSAWGGWGVLDERVRSRIEAGAASTLEVMGGLFGTEGNGGEALVEAVERAVEAQHFLFPALVGLSSLAALGLVWWMHVRIQTGSSAGLGPLRSFRFPDPLIWLLVAGIGLLVMAGWGTELGRIGANLMVFMGGLYALRGFGVVLFVTGGLSVPAWILTTVAAILAPPLLLGGAMAIGIGDSWFDLRSRWAAAPGTETD